MPPMWPSRLKVLGMIGTQMSVYASIFSYLRNANFSYLDLSHAKPPAEIHCVVPLIDPCQSDPDIEKCLARSDYNNWLFDTDIKNSSACATVPPSVQSRNCSNPELPLSVFQGLSGRLHTSGGGPSFWKAWLYGFIVIATIHMITMLVHDIALLDAKERQTIYTLADATKEIPNVRTYLMCFGCRKRKYRRVSGKFNSFEPNRRTQSSLTNPLTESDPDSPANHSLLNDCMTELNEPDASPEFYLRKVMWRRVLWPLWAILQTVLFLVVIYPSSMVLFVMYPVRMSRIVTFLTASTSAAWAVIFVIWSLSTYPTQYYDIRWTPNTGPDFVPGRDQRCLCMCQYPLNLETFARLVFLGVMIAGHGVLVCLRAIKGLRHGEWAVLFSVLHAIPIGAYPVRWGRPKEAGGGPIRYRDADEPVQDEPAFDPFALMDEQPESGHTSILFSPVCREGRQKAFQASFNDGIGHCGFPGPFPSDFREKSVGMRAYNLLRACIAGCFIHPTHDGALTPSPEASPIQSPPNMPKADSRHSLASDNSEF